MTPVADHHAHIWSAKAAALSVPPILPAVDLPKDLADLFQQREDRVRAGAYEAAAELFTEDAQVLIMLAPAWVRGPTAVRFATRSTAAVHLVPNHYVLDDTIGYVTGTGVFPQRPDHHVTNFFIVVLRDTAGRWRIAAETITPNAPPVARAISAEHFVAELDAANVRRGVLLSVAYMFASPHHGGPEERSLVRMENEWLSRQVARHPERLVGFGSVNPLKEHAVEEIAAIAASPNLSGLKLHLGNSEVDLRREDHSDALRRTFAAANEHRLPVLAHMMVLGMQYGRDHAEAFIEHVLPAAPDVPVQIAHLAGSGPGHDGDDALVAYIDAIAANRPQMRRVSFDVASTVVAGASAESLTLIAERLRQIGLERVLFGSDRAGDSNDSPQDAWRAFRRLPLREDEFRIVATNLAPYMRPSGRSRRPSNA